MKEGMVALTLRQDDIYKASNPKEFERFNVMLEKQVDFHRALVLESTLENIFTFSTRR